MTAKESFANAVLGNPPSSSHTPSRVDTVAAFSEGYDFFVDVTDALAANFELNSDKIDAIVVANGSSGVPYALASEFNTDLSFDDLSRADVYGDTEANNGAWRKDGAAGTGSWSRVSDTSVVALSVAFNELYPTSINLFNINGNVTLNAYVNSDGNTLSSSTYHVTDYIPVSPSTTYFKSNTHSHAFYTAAKGFISHTPNPFDPSGSSLTTPATAAFIRITVFQTAWDSFMFHQGSTAADYVSFGRKLSMTSIDENTVSGALLLDGSVPALKLDSIQMSINLFDPNDPDVELGKFVNTANGTTGNNATYNVTGFIPVEELETYFLSYTHSHAYFNSNKSFISSSPNPNDPTPSSFSSPANTAFVRVTVAVSEWDDFMLHKGSVAADYIPYGPFLDTAIIPPSANATSANNVIAANFTPDGAYLFNNPSRTDLLRQTHLALSKFAFGESHQMIITMGGDSFVEEHLRSTNEFTEYLVAMYGDAGGGFCGLPFRIQTGQSAPWTSGNQPQFMNTNPRPTLYPVKVYGNVTSTYNEGGGPSLGVLTMSQVGDKVTLGIPASPTHNEIILGFIGSLDGRIGLSWDGGTVTEYDVQGVVGTYQEISVPNIPVGAGLLTVERISGTSDLTHFNCKSDASGVRVNVIAGTGSDVSQWALTDSRWDDSYASLGTTVHFYLDGTNSQTGNMAPTTWRQHLSTHYDRIISASPTTDVIFVTPAENTRGKAVPISDYEIQALGLQSEKRFALLRLQNFYGAPSTPELYAYDSAFPMNVDDGADSDSSNDVHPSQSLGGRTNAGAFLKTMGVPLIPLRLL